MNIIRTTAVELTTIPAIAYKQKLKAGGSGLRILRLDQDIVGVFTIDKNTGLAIPYGKINEALFPEEAIDEALGVTQGLPYSARGKIKVTKFEEKAEENEVTEADTNDIDMVSSKEYAAIVDRYTNEKGKINYQLMNKDFIQFASRSKTVANMVTNKATEEEILAFIVKNRASFLSGNEDLSDADTTLLIETLDEINPRSAFKELKEYIRRLLGKSSRPYKEVL